MPFKEKARKTKDLRIDFRKPRPDFTVLLINSAFNDLKILFESETFRVGASFDVQNTCVATRKVPVGKLSSAKVQRIPLFAKTKNTNI